LQLAYYYSMLPDTNSSAGSQYESVTERVANFDRLSNRQKALTVMMKLDELVPESVRPISNPELSLQIAKMFYDMGRPDEMMRRLELLTARTDLRLEVRMRIAGFWAAYAKDEPRAREIVEEALGSAPTAEQCYTAGRELFSAGSHALAAQLFERALALNPNDGQSIGALMQAYEYSGDKGKARAALQEWVTRHPSDRGAKERLDQMMAVDSGAPRSLN
jgi:tetratricopeptide (TPR) repeat protein